MIVVDSNVMVSALRSSRGASHLVLRDMLNGTLSFALSPAIMLEYEDVLKRPELKEYLGWITPGEIEQVLDALCKTASLVLPWFRFRPFLDDPKDDIYIECALAAGATHIISNDRHFQHPAVSGFGLSVMTAGELVADIRRRCQ